MLCAGAGWNNSNVLNTSCWIMLMFSRKGLAAFIGIGILLSVLGSSEGIRCYECENGGNCNSDKSPEEKDCPGQTSCRMEWDNDKAFIIRCGNEYVKSATADKPKCAEISKTYQTCDCFTARCNEAQKTYSDFGGASGGSGPAASKNGCQKLRHLSASAVQLSSSSGTNTFNGGQTTSNILSFGSGLSSGHGFGNV